MLFFERFANHEVEARALEEFLLQAVVEFVFGEADDNTSHEAGIEAPFAREVVEGLEILLCLRIRRSHNEGLKFVALRQGLVCCKMSYSVSRPTMLTHRCGCRGSAVAVDQNDLIGAYSALK